MSPGFFRGVFPARVSTEAIASSAILSVIVLAPLLTLFEQWQKDENLVSV